MKISNPQVKKLLEKYREIDTLNKIGAVVGWDLNVNLPPKGSESRANQIAYLTELTVEKWLDPEFKKILTQVKEQETKLLLEEKAIIRNLEHSGKLYFRVPKDIIVEIAKTTSQAFVVWSEAKKKNRFVDFSPHLEKIIKLSRTTADYLGFKENRYDALLDFYEQGLTTSKLKSIFIPLAKSLAVILRKIKTSKIYKNNSDFVGDMSFDANDQKQLALFVLKKMNYDLKAGRMDISPHPFTSTLGSSDVRITNRYKPNDFRDSLMIGMHECGHALYEQGFLADYAGTPLEGGISLGIHESQSRFWENQVGRSLEFMKFMTPIFHAFYPEQLSDVSADELYKLFNVVKSSLIRTEADEVTYNFHIILRFELEEALINNRIKVKDLPEVWSEKMKKYLGIVPKTDSEGVLQDVHWSYGSIGYFPTYSLGNLYGAQITQTMKKDLNLADLCERGELGTILAWFRKNIHQYGSLYWPGELIKKVTGEELNPKYFLDYIKDKYSKIYEVKL